MTIHHDKLAYGKLAPTSEELTEEQMLEMLARLNGEEEADAPSVCGQSDSEVKKPAKKRKK